jgi:hypothetical protein
LEPILDRACGLSGGDAMIDRVLFVDLENVQKFDLLLVPDDARVFIFYGITQKNLAKYS